MWLDHLTTNMQNSLQETVTELRHFKVIKMGLNLHANMVEPVLTVNTIRLYLYM